MVAPDDDSFYRGIRVIVMLAFMIVWGFAVGFGAGGSVRLSLFIISAPLSLAVGEFTEWFVRAQIHLLDANPHFRLQDHSTNAMVVGEALLDSASATGSV